MLHSINAFDIGTQAGKYDTSRSFVLEAYPVHAYKFKSVKEQLLTAKAAAEEAKKPKPAETEETKEQQPVEDEVLLSSAPFIDLQMTATRSRSWSQPSPRDQVLR